jgi:hypothetical protein
VDRGNRGFGDRVWATAILRNQAVPTKVTTGARQVLMGLSPADRAITVSDSAD